MLAKRRNFLICAAAGILATIQVGTCYWLWSLYRQSSETTAKVDMFLDPGKQLGSMADVRLDKLEAETRDIRKMQAGIIDAMDADREIRSRRDTATDRQINDAQAEAASANARSQEPCIIHGIC